jgi:hypothetical protein
MLNPRSLLRASVFALLLPLFCATHVSLAYGQSFSFTTSPLQPPAVNPGQNATSIIDLTASGGFDSPVSFNCIVTSSDGSVPASPTCVVSPPSQTPPADGPAITVSTLGAPAGQYSIVVTGTSGSLTPQTATLILNVLNVPEDYIISVSKAISPTSVEAGLGASATITVTPIGSYGDANPPNQVTLSCLSVSPTVTSGPYCTFASSSGSPSVPVTSLAPATATAKPWKPRMFYGFWLAVPGLALLGAGAAGKRRRWLVGMLLLMVVTSGLLLMPACNATTNNGTKAANGDVTPDGTYTFTITGVDQTGIAPSNNNTGNEAATVSLTITKAP